MQASLRNVRSLYQFGQSFSSKRLYRSPFCNHKCKNIILRKTLPSRQIILWEHSPLLSIFANNEIQLRYIQTRIPNHLCSPNSETKKSTGASHSKSKLPPPDPTAIDAKSESSASTSSSTQSEKQSEPGSVNEAKETESTTSVSETNKKSVAETNEKTVAETNEKSVAETNEKTVAETKPSLYKRFVNEVKHYYHGIRLLGLDFKIAARMSFRLLRGDTLTRRERKQLVRTTADLFRLLPFAVFLIIPFMEFLLPFYIRFFPFMMPSTFKEEEKEKLERRQKLKAKLEIAKFLQDTIAENVKVKNKDGDSLSLEEFQSFLKRVRESGQMADTKDIVRFSRLFEDEVTLDSLDRPHLKALCQLLELNTMGPNQLLRILLRMRLRQLKVDDRMIYEEGVDKIAVWELQQLCRERGMRSLGLSENRLRHQLSQWLDLHLEQNMPLTLLLFSRAMYLPEYLTSEEKLTQAIASMPKSAAIEAALKAAESSPGRIDNKTKFEAIKEEEARLKMEKKREKEALKDAAPVVKAKPSEELEPQETSQAPKETKPDPIADRLHIPTDTQPIIQSDISAKDLEQLESAIESIALEEEELDDLKGDVAEMKKLREQAALINPNKAKSKSQKNATKLANRVNQMIGEMDSLIDKLHDERQELLVDIEVKEVHVKHKADNSSQIEDQIAEKKERVVDINDVMLSLRRIQKVDDETKWQQILEVLDEDHDGKIELNHVLQVIKFVGSDNVKLNPETMTKVLEIIDKEADMAKKMRENEAKNAKTASESENSPTEDKTDQSNEKDDVKENR